MALFAWIQRLIFSPLKWSLGVMGSLLFLSGPVYAQSGDSPSGKSTEFWVSEPQPMGSFLEFKYYTPYPGVTKVRLLDSEGKLLWRNQYNDSTGYNKAVYRWHLLNPGTYCFKFSYKLSEERRYVTAPGYDTE